MDSPKPPLLQSLTPFSRILFAVLLMIACFTLVFLAGILAAVPIFGLGLSQIMTTMTLPAGQENVALLEYFQVVQSFGLFIFPPLLAGWLFERSSVRFLALGKASPWPFYLATFLLMFISLPFINWLIAVNGNLHLPAALQEMEEWMRSTEEQATRLTDAFMAMPSFTTFLFNLFMVAALPAIGEEFVFRGLFQRLFREWLGNIHTAILLSAILFSALHMQFFGFLPRLALGILFGYLFYYSGSLWVPVFAHFLNNGAAVVVEYLSQSGMLHGNYEDFGATHNVLLIVLSGLSVLLLFFWLHRRYHR